MSVLIVELYDALKDAGASEEKSRAAAKAVSDNDARLAKIEGVAEGTRSQIEGVKSQFDGVKSQIEGIKSQGEGFKAQFEAVKMRIDALTWVVGLTAAMSIAILVRSFFP